MRFDLTNRTDTERMEFCEPESYVTAFRAWDDDPQERPAGDEGEACTIFDFMKRNDDGFYVSVIELDDDPGLEALMDLDRENHILNALFLDEFVYFAEWLEGCPDLIQCASLAYLMENLHYSIEAAVEKLGAPDRFRLIQQEAEEYAQQHYAEQYADALAACPPILLKNIDWDLVAEFLRDSGAAAFYEFADEHFVCTDTSV